MVRVNAFACDGCEKLYRRSESNELHMKLCSKVVPSDAASDSFLCDRCGVFTTEPHACVQDSDATRSDRVLGGEMTTEPNAGSPKEKKLYPCRTCEKVFANVQNRWRHEKIHTKYKVQCDECDQSFTRKDTLKMHKQKSHGEAAEKLACEECGTMFSKKENLTRHKCGGSIAKATKRRVDEIAKVARKKRKQLVPKDIFDKLKRYVGGRL